MRRAFTLIELLVVLAVIVVLAGLLLTGTNALWERARRVRTETSFGVIQQAVAVAASERRGFATAIEHPLAGSAAPRAAFVRQRDGSAVAVSGTAYRGLSDPSRLPVAQRSQLLLADDLHADAACPLLFLLPRRDIGILGANQAAVTAYRKLVDGGSTPIADPDAVSQPVAGRGQAADHAPLLQGLLGSFVAELSELGCWRAPPADFNQPLVQGRVLGDGASHSGWAPGRVLDGAWQAYRLPGLALVDGWGREILISNAERGQRLRLQSAGRDGVFRWLPGANGRIDASPAAAAAALGEVLPLDWATAGALGDDRRGDRDNLTALLEGQP